MTLTNYVIKCIKDAYLTDFIKQKEQLADKHHKLNHTDTSPPYYIIRYKDLIINWGNPVDLHKIITRETLHKDLWEQANKLIEDSHKAHKELNRLKNYISFIERQVPSATLLKEYIPEYFLQDFYLNEHTFSKHLKENEFTDIVSNRFSEEIKLFKKYYLMVRMHLME